MRGGIVGSGHAGSELAVDTLDGANDHATASRESVQTLQSQNPLDTAPSAG
jgi:hypothetical protein